MNNVFMFLEYLSGRGYKDLPGSFPYNEIQRFRNGKTDSDGDKPGWLVLYSNPDGSAVGLAGDWRQGDSTQDCWVSKYDNGHKLSEFEDLDRTRLIKETKERLKSEFNEKHRKVAEKCREIWENSTPADPEHPYLKRKGIKPYGIRQTLRDGFTVLVVPLGDHDGIQTLEYIYPDKKPGTERNKDLESGGRTKGTWFQIGEGSPRFICEGYATACSVFEATEKPVVMAYSAGNLVNVAEIFPQACIVADCDESKTGENKAREASQKYGNRVVVIPEIGQDANDYALSHGLDALRSLLIVRDYFGRGGSLLNQGDPMKWLIRDWIPEGKSLLQIYAQSGTGKTLLVLDWILSICTGQPDWFGHLVRPGKCIYFFGEGRRGLSKRIAYWSQEHGGIDKYRDILDNNLIYNSKPMPKIDDMPQLSYVKEMIEAESFKPDLICLDTLNRACLGDENSTKDMTVFVSACDDLASLYDCPVLLIHHTGWSQESKNRGRGSSVVRSSLDMDMFLEQKGEVLKLSQTKNKDNETATPEYLRIYGGVINGWIDSDGFPVTGATITKTEEPEEQKSDKQINDEQLIQSAFKEHGYLDADDRVCITRKNLLKFLNGKLLDKNEQPLDEKRLQGEVNPNQNKFVGRLVRTGFIETIQGTGRTPEGWRLSEGVANLSVSTYLKQQAELEI